MRMTEIIHFAPSSAPAYAPTSIPMNDENLKTEPAFRSPLYRRRRSNRKMAVETEYEQAEEGDILAVLLTVLRKSLVGCSSPGNGDSRVEDQRMEIGWPTDVKHVAHVTFDRFNGFLGLPVELFPEIPCKPPSASFGVSTESMQLSFDPRGNCVPTILLMMQKSLCSQNGLKAEGIFRINPENSQEEQAREKLNQGLIPDNIDVHCLAALIKAWFRELPHGVLDSLPLEKMMRAHSENECEHLVNLLPQTEASLLNWVVDLMADVVLFEHLNKMNAHNIAMVFAPNMTKMSDPVTALMHAVQVMNFLKTLIMKTIRERKGCLVEDHRSIDSTSEIHGESEETVQEHAASSTSSSYKDKQVFIEMDSFVIDETRAIHCDLVNYPVTTEERGSREETEDESMPDEESE